MITKKITLAIVDDHTLFREGLASLMEEFHEIEVVFQAKDGIEFQTKIVKNENIDIVLMDIGMPGMDGYATTKWIKANYAHIQVLALSMFEDEKAIIKMLKSGASGYILKESRPSDLLAAIKMILLKGFYVNDLVSARLFTSLLHKNPDSSFKNRDLAFLQLCCSDLTYKDIADVMNVSPRTVDNYRETLFLKLGVKSRIGLVVYGIKNGLINI